MCCYVCVCRSYKRPGLELVKWKGRALSLKFYWTEKRPVQPAYSSSWLMNRDQLPKYVMEHTVVITTSVWVHSGAFLQFREQIQDLIEKNAAALGAQKQLEAELNEVTNTHTHTQSHSLHHHWCNSGLKSKAGYWFTAGQETTWTRHHSSREKSSTRQGVLLPTVILCRLLVRHYLPHTSREVYFTHDSCLSKRQRCWS